MRKDLPQHLDRDCPHRDFKCSICGELGTYGHIVYAHVEKCILKNLDVVDKLQDGNSKLCEHLAEAVLNLRKSAYDSTLSLANAREKESESRALLLEKVKPPSAESALQIQQLRDSLNAAFTFKITNFLDKVKAVTIIKTRPFYTKRESRGYCMVVEVHLKHTYISIFVHMVAGISDDKLPWPFAGEITFSLLNQLDDSDHYVETLTVRDLSVGSTMVGLPYFISEMCCGLETPEKGQRFLVDDTIYLSVHVKESKSWLMCSKPR
jgi:hypothetical protein